jgi:hypothetical protein
MDVTLASSSFHLTADFWAVVGVAATLAAIAVSVILWLRGSPQRLLLYSLISQTALLSNTARYQAGPDLQVMLRGEVLDDPHVVSIRVKSRSRRDVRTADFENGNPLRFSLGSPVLRTLDTDTGGEAMPKVPIGTEGSAILVGPGLIKKGQVISIDLLTDGPVALTCPNPALADVTVRRQDDDDTRFGLIPKIAVWTVGILMVVFVVSNPFVVGEGVYSLVSSATMSGLVVIIVVLVVPILVWSRALRRNRSR